jgi:hypothetical protein
VDLELLPEEKEDSSAECRPRWIYIHEDAFLATLTTTPPWDNKAFVALLSQPSGVSFASQGQADENIDPKSKYDTSG